MKRPLLWVFVAVAILSHSVSARRHTGAAPPPPMVVAQAIQTDEVYDALIYPARLVSRVNATLLAESDGVVQAVRKSLGSRVTVGEPILTLTNPDPVYTFEPFNVLSPVTGVISSIDIALGSRVAKGQKLGTVTDPAQVLASIEITVSDLDAIHTGMVGELELAGLAQPIPMKVSGISPIVDPATGTASAELKPVDKKHHPPPGMVGRLRFRARLHQGIQLPESAIFYRGETPLVRVLDGDKAVFREVKIGHSRQGRFEITSGLKAGEKVVLRTNTFIADGEAVTLQKDGEGT